MLTISAVPAASRSVTAAPAAPNRNQSVRHAQARQDSDGGDVDDPDLQGAFGDPELSDYTIAGCSCLNSQRLSRAKHYCQRGFTASSKQLMNEIATGDLYDLQERYVVLFDRSRSLSLHLFEHVHGESRDRGQAMVDLKSLYEDTGSNRRDRIAGFRAIVFGVPLDAATRRGLRIARSTGTYFCGVGRAPAQAEIPPTRPFFAGSQRSRHRSPKPTPYRHCSPSRTRRDRSRGARCGLGGPAGQFRTQR